MFHPATSTNFRRGNAWAKGFQNPGSKTKTEAGERLRWIDRYRTVPYRTVGLQTSGKAASVWLGNRARERQGEGPHRSTMSFFSFACKMAKRCPCRLPVCPSVRPSPRSQQKDVGSCTNQPSSNIHMDSSALVLQAKRGSAEERTTSNGRKNYASLWVFGPPRRGPSIQQ